MDVHGYHRISTDIHGYPRISMDTYGYPGISMDIHGCPLISMDIHGYPWISMDIHGCQWISMDGKLEGSFMTKYLQIGFWISPKAKGFWLNGLRRKSILKTDPPKKVSGKLENLPESSFVDKMASFFMPFFGGRPHGARDHWRQPVAFPCGHASMWVSWWHA